MNIVLVNLQLIHPNPKDAAEDGLTVDLCFNEEPTKEALFLAFQEVPSIQHHEYFEVYRRRLFECLETYGVPKLDKFSMITPEGAPITVPMVYALWHLNLVAPTGTALGVRVGSIRVSRRLVHQVHPEVHDPEPDPLRDLEPYNAAPKEGGANMTALRKNIVKPSKRIAKPRKTKSTKP
jgi:hypothetical protein